VNSRAVGPHRWGPGSHFRVTSGHSFAGCLWSGHDGRRSSAGEEGSGSVVGQESAAVRGNRALRALVEEAAISHGGLARAVVLAGAETGWHVGTNTTSVRRMLEGCQPRHPVPHLVARVLSRRLRREISVTECGFADRSPVVEDQDDGLRCAGTLDGTIRTVVETGHASAEVAAGLGVQRRSLP
jgi:hypothetical protein